MKSDPGADCCMSAPVEDQIRSSSIFRTGQVTRPGARRHDDVRRLVARSCCRPVGLDLDLAGFPASRPKPSMCVTLFFLKRCATPLFIWVTTRRLRSCAGPRSYVTFSAMIPCRSPSFISLTRSALVRSALVGMQPMLRQTPPRWRSSTHATFIPSCAARIAATYPPGPLPTTIRSKRSLPATWPPMYVEDPAGSPKSRSHRTPKVEVGDWAVKTRFAPGR